MLKKIIVTLFTISFLANYLYSQNPVKLSKKQKNEHKELADIYFSSGSFSKALDEYNLLIKHKWPKKIHIDILSKKGLCHEALKQYDLAIESFQECIELEPKNWKHHLNIARVYEKTSLNSQAVIEYKKVIELNGDKFSAYYGIGRIYQSLGLNSQAIDNYKKALIIKSEPSLYRNLSKCYEIIRNWEIASEILKQAISIEPTAEDYLHLALLYSYQNRYDDTIECLRIAGDKNPERLDIKFHLVAAYFKKEDYESAKNLLRVLEETNPDNPLVFFLSGFIHYFEGNIHESKEKILKSGELAKTPMLKEYSEIFLKTIEEKLAKKE
ncbi:MAG: tetratricopeptide repeat protein [Endomicrobiia bacterium]